MMRVYTLARKWSTSCRAYGGSELTSRTQIVSSRSAQGSVSWTALIAIVRSVR
jgi:hypothetical protein